MKVTEEMVERAKRARVHTLAMAWEKAERIVLEAALADVPEPVVYRGELRRAEARIAELEAQLAEQRERAKR